MDPEVFLHIGANEVVPLHEIVAILDAGVARQSASTRQFLGFMRSKARLIEVGDGDGKAYVICRDSVYLSPISPGTLRRRIQRSDLV